MEEPPDRERIHVRNTIRIQSTHSLKDTCASKWGCELPKRCRSLHSELEFGRSDRLKTRTMARLANWMQLQNMTTFELESFSKLRPWLLPTPYYR